MSFLGEHDRGRGQSVVQKSNGELDGGGDGRMDKLFDEIKGVEGVTLLQQEIVQEPIKEQQQPLRISEEVTYNGIFKNGQENAELTNE
jgi:hypothetical protein